MLRNYVVIALRNLMRDKVVTGINWAYPSPSPSAPSSALAYTAL